MTTSLQHSRSTPPSPRWLGLFDSVEALRPSKSLRRRLRATRLFFFVAYAREDAPRLQPLLKAAKEQGYVLWIDQLELTPGGVWPADLIAAIRASRALIAFCSAVAFASREVYREIAAASRFNKPILPIYLDDATAPDEFQYYLAVHQAISLSEADWRIRFLCALEAMEKGHRRWFAPKRKLDCPPTLVAN